MERWGQLDVKEEWKKDLETCPSCGATYLHLYISTCVCGKKICTFCKHTFHSNYSGSFVCSEKCSIQSAKNVLAEYRAISGAPDPEEEKEKSCCYITSACLDDLDLSRDSVEMTALKTLTKEHILKSFGGMRDYLLYGKRAPRIVEAIRARADSREIWLGVDACLKDVASLVASGKYEEGYKFYKSLVLGLEKRFAK